MSLQIDRETFSQALSELGHDPKQYKGQKVSLDAMAKLYQFNKDSLLSAIEQKALSAHYDYIEDEIWIDALEAAHFYYCVSSAQSLEQWHNLEALDRSPQP